MKTIALYLPQFHRIPENDKWWGEGYTEWTAVRNAEKLYDNHYQPHVPLNDNYYDLLQKETLQWQAGLMKKYNVYGMCFYHYYFKDGRKILERPAENLLKWKEIDMPFCFSWANETWARTWSKISEKNAWNNLEEKNHSEDDNGILLMQDYGKEKEWEEHFNYLFPFFADSRYIKADKKPVFVIYKPDSIACITQMMEKWNELAQKNGMEGIYFIATNTERKGFSAYLHQGPSYFNIPKREQIMDYNELCSHIIRDSVLAEDNCCFCGISGYDDSPRRGQNGTIVENSSPEKFYDLMRILFWVGEKRGNEFTFVNAWNEWGEGMHLEPDKKYEYGYLEALSKAFTDYKDIDEAVKQKLAIMMGENEIKKYLHTHNIRLQRNSSLMRLLDRWLYIKESQKTLQTYFYNNNYKNIAIYGLGMAGNHLIAELRNSQLNVIYGIDKSGNQLTPGFPVYTLKEELPKADVLVVTVISDFDSIYKMLKCKFDGPIVSLEEIVNYEMLRLL